MSHPEWLSIWFTPGPDDYVAFMPQIKIAEHGGMNTEVWERSTWANNVQYINQGVAVLIRWCRLNCTTIPTPVNVKGKTGFAFSNSQDAVLFKLTWG